VSNGEAIQRVLAALERAGCSWKHQGAGYSTQCPAHDDHRPSLVVTPGVDKNGKSTVFLNCHTGCHWETVLTAMGLTGTDLYDEPRGTGKTASKRIVATYDYLDANGVLLYQKVKYFPKDFRVRRPNGNDWIWSIGASTPRVLYRLPEVLTAIASSVTIYICEGESDVDRLVALGYVATCNYDGASKDTQRPKWRDSYSDTLKGSNVVIIADNDDPGFAHARAVTASLVGKAAHIKLVMGMVDTPHADISDHLDAGYTIDQLVPLDTTPAIVPATTNGHHPGPVTVAVEEDGNTVVRRLRPTPASGVTMRRIRWLWESRIPLGGLTLLAGREGIGKSLVAVALTALITRGELPGERYGEPSTVIYIPSEDARDYTIVPRLHAAGADLDKVIFLDAVDFDPNQGEEVESPIVLPLDTDLLAAAVDEHNAVMVILDAATSVIDHRLDGDKDRQMRQALEAIARKVGERTGTAVLGIVHFGKRESADTGKLILGSIAWSQVARSTLAVAQDTDTGDLTITGSKTNLASGNTPSLACRIESVDVDTEEGVTSVGKIVWLGETDTDARDLLDAGEAAAGRAERNEARDWLHDWLSAGQVKSSAAKRAAAAAGISERTLQRARAALQVRVTAEGYPRETYWSLPATEEGRAKTSGLARVHTGTTGSTTTDLHKHTDTTVAQPWHDTGTTRDADPPVKRSPEDYKHSRATTNPSTAVPISDATAVPMSASPLPAVSRVVPAVPMHSPASREARQQIRAIERAQLEARLVASMGTTPHTLEALTVKLDEASLDDIERALRRLAETGVVQQPSHGNRAQPQTWSVVTRRSPDLDASGDKWVHAHLTTSPQTVVRLATDLDAPVPTVEAALQRLAGIGHAQHHPSQSSKPAGWSLPAKQENL
jgi:hypothetical protein